jgi:hypothetical protein
MVLRNMRIAQLNDKLTNALTNFDIDAMRSCLDSIEANQVEGIDQDALAKAEEMIEEFNNNPNWLAEK